MIRDLIRMSLVIFMGFIMKKNDGINNFTMIEKDKRSYSIRLSKNIKRTSKQTKKKGDEYWGKLEVTCVSTIRLCIIDNIINCIFDDDSTVII